MMTIHKYPLKITDEQTLIVPDGAKFLSAQFQGSELCLWAIVEPELERVTRKIVIVGTGNCAQGVNPEKYIATVQHPGRPFVWHIFER